MATKQDVWRRMGTATRVFNAELKNEIARQKAIDTGRMKNVSRVFRLEWNESKNNYTFEINSTFYYKFVDEGLSRKWFSRQRRRNITKAFMKRKKVLEQMDKLMEVLFEYRIDQQFK